MNFEEILSFAHGTFEEQHRVLGLSTIILLITVLLLMHITIVIL